METRRKFTRFLLLALASLFLPTTWLQAKTRKIAFRLQKVKKLSKVGGWAILKIKGHPLLFVRESEETVRTLDSICSHKECSVEYNPELGLIVCPCHGSTYDLEGQVLKPPAEHPLRAYETVLTDDRVIVTLGE